MSTGQPYPGNIDESQDQYTVSVSRSIRATPERIWKVIGTAEGMRDWMYMLNWQPRLGGRMLLDVSGASEAERIIVFGRVLEIEEARLVRMSWRVLHEDGRLWPDDTEVAISLEPESGGTLVRLVHSGFERLAEHRSQAYSVYHHCWVQAAYLKRLDDQPGAQA
ncbi:MAG: SRPBCC domain-containing protein [Planctomycetales bacterium]|nr:SRPBCC domain-containing protein [bacterium]UNM09429.1 MAG: SRPBCC domain-containing protein [Planctomycetales bacterium]